jgi:hypothetical protein
MAAHHRWWAALPAYVNGLHGGGGSERRGGARDEFFSDSEQKSSRTAPCVRRGARSLLLDAGRF